MRTDLPRLVIAGPGSGSGKTTLSCALLLALKRAGYNPAAFKCGPDYIDPMFHASVLGLDSCNLDVFLCGEDAVGYLLAENGKGHDVAVIEGVMGLYDGLGTGEYGSTNHVARLTGTPEVLVLSPRGQSLTLAAQLSGYLNFAENTIKGVIFNRTSAKMYPFYRDLVEERLGLTAYGSLPPLPEAGFGSRHLGLITPDEIRDMRTRMNILADACAASVDLRGLMELARSAGALEYADLRAEKTTDVTIAVARDKAFCFYYRDAFDFLRELGASLAFFSPLEDERLPEEASGLILGGGYPEEYAATLSANRAMRESIRRAVNEGLPVMAECGGFMYLCRTLRDVCGETSEMAGVVPSDAFMTKSLGRFGYVTLKAVRDTFLCPRGTEFHGHEFHYGDATDNGDAFTARKAGGASWPCIHASGPDDARKIFAGFPHIHFRGCPGLAKAFAAACREYAEKRACVAASDGAGRSGRG